MSFYELTLLDRRKFLAGLLCSGAAMGVLPLGLSVDSPDDAMAALWVDLPEPSFMVCGEWQYKLLQEAWRELT